MRKAVFFDVDGTLVSYSTNPSHIPEPTLEALRRLQKKGHVVSLATGRCHATVGKLMRQLGIENAVLLSGAHVLSEGRSLSVTRLGRDLARKYAATGMESGCSVFACCDRYVYTSGATEDSLDYIREQSGEDILRTIDEMDDACYMNLFGESLPDSSVFSSVDVVYEQGWMEIRPPGISKATGIQALAGHFGIALCDTVAFGDGGNDLEMLREAGVGVAVGNGSDAAKAAARVVTEPIDDGGIYLALKRLELI